MQRDFLLWAFNLEWFQPDSSFTTSHHMIWCDWDYITSPPLHGRLLIHLNAARLLSADQVKSKYRSAAHLKRLKALAELIKGSMVTPRKNDLATANLFQHAVEGFRAADVETDEDGVWVGVGERPHVVVVRRSWNQGKQIQIKWIRTAFRAMLMNFDIDPVYEIMLPGNIFTLLI